MWRLPGLFAWLCGLSQNPFASSQSNESQVINFYENIISLLLQENVTIFCQVNTVKNQADKREPSATTCAKDFLILELTAAQCKHLHFIKSTLKRRGLNCFQANWAYSSFMIHERVMAYLIHWNRTIRCLAAPSPEKERRNYVQMRKLKEHNICNIRRRRQFA